MSTPEQVAASVALSRILAYASGMVVHHEREGFGDARSWRVVAAEARQVLGPDEAPPRTTDADAPIERAPTDDELERLLLRCRAVKRGKVDLGLPAHEAHELIERLTAELLLWRHSHPSDLPG